jgi:hypothetical protein
MASGRESRDRAGPNLKPPAQADLLSGPSGRRMRTGLGRSGRPSSTAAVAASASARYGEATEERLPAFLPVLMTGFFATSGPGTPLSPVKRAAGPGRSLEDPRLQAAVERSHRSRSIMSAPAHSCRRACPSPSSGGRQRPLRVPGPRTVARLVIYLVAGVVLHRLPHDHARSRSTSRCPARDGMTGLVCTSAKASPARGRSDPVKALHRVEEILTLA